MVIAGIDIGGTFIKAGLCNFDGEIICNGSIPTDATEQGLIKGVKEIVSNLLAKKKIPKSELAGIGMGIPGMIDGQNGCIRYSNNIVLENFYISRELEKEFNVPVRITNDANAAALGEAKFGSGKGYKNSVLLTLGTGVGSGIILNGEIFEGNGGAGAELGHSVVIAGGEKCTCGRRGCLEAYASATALIRSTKRAMEQNPNSLMWKICPKIEEVDGKTAFSCRDKDATARKVVDDYIYYLGEGILNVANIFRPEVVMIGGGISKEGDSLIRPLQEKIDAEIFGGKHGPKVEIRVASLGNKAGLIGAAALFID